MNIDSEYSKNFFDVWYDGLSTMRDEENAGIVPNSGNVPDFPKVQL